MNARGCELYPNKMGETVCTLEKYEISIDNLWRWYSLKLHLFGVYVCPRMSWLSETKFAWIR